MSDLNDRHQRLIAFIRELYGNAPAIALHAPRFAGNEKTYLIDCIDSTFVSSVGPYVVKFEDMMRDITGAKYAVAMVSGTAALHLAMIVAGVQPDNEVITQPLSFVATSNAIAYQHAHPVFLDVDPDTLSLSPIALRQFLEQSAERKPGGCFNRASGRRIAAVVPMHTFGLPGRAEELAAICAEWGVPMVEDAAEALGTSIGGRHAGTFGLIGAFSFNGNKTITSGGGGALITNDDAIAHAAKHLSTTAKLSHPWDFFHDQLGYNYRLPNINAALACAQLEQLPAMLHNKRETAARYGRFCAEERISFVSERQGCRANYWLNTVLMNSLAERDHLLQLSNANGVMTRPAWTLLNQLPAFRGAQCDTLDNARWLVERIVNLPSSVRA